MNKIFYFFKQQIYSIKNLIDWFPVIWNQREWDQHYFYVLLKKKLEKMEKFYRSNKAHHVDAGKDADNIHYCIVRLDRLVNENYLAEALIPFDEKFPNYSWEPKFKELPNGYFEYVNTDTDEQIELHRICYKKSEEMEEDDLDELFAQIRLHVQEWWD